MKFLPISYAPDVENAWSVAPGSLAALTNLAPLQSGYYGTVSDSAAFTAAEVGSVGWTFKKTDGTVRLFVASGNLYEYSGSGTATNRGAIGAPFNMGMCAWGNEVFAVSMVYGMYSSTS